MYTFNLSLKDKKIEINTNLNKIELGGFTGYFCGTINSQKNDPIEVLKRNHGVLIRIDDSAIEVFSDPFCSLPIYIYSNDSELYIDSIFENIAKKRLSVDIVGCYENLMYSSGLFDRTPFLEVKQLPAASKMVYSRFDSKIEIRSYWDYCIKCCESVSDEEAVNKVWNAFSQIYRGFAGKNIIMGVSGGLDSRLSLCLLKSESTPKEIKTFTFGHNKCIKDYSIAKKTCKKISVNKPFFFRISEETYKNSKELPIKTCGSVSINHGHIYNAIDSFDLDGYTLISNYFSDGVMGYDCRPTDSNDYAECDYYKIFLKNEWNAPREILEEIENDLKKVIFRRGEGDNYSGYNEFIYLTERNPKFHMRLSYLFSEKINVELPFADYSIMESVISLPVSIRYYKRIERLLLKQHLKDYMDVSSTRYAGLDKQESKFLSKLYYNGNFIVMRLINCLNSGLKLLSNGYVQIPNPFITENYISVFDRVFSKDKKKADAVLKRVLGMKISNNPLKKLNYRTSDATRGFEMISLAYVIMKCVDIDR